MASNIPVIVQGNSFNLAIPLQIYVINGDQMELQDYTPDPTDQISIQLKGSRRNYTYTPTSVTDNVCMIALGGYELADNYSVVVSIVKANGQRLRSFRTDQFFIVESSDDLTQDDIIEGLEENVIYLNSSIFVAGADGRGIVSILKTATAGLVDTYTITYTDTTTSTFNVTNGAPGTQGEDGVGITSIEKTATAGLVDTYTITLSNGNTSTFDVTNGKDGYDLGLASIINNLTAGGSTDALSAEMGKVINSVLDISSSSEVVTERIPYVQNIGYINANSITQQSKGHLRYSDPIFLKAGDSLKIKGITTSNVGRIATCDAQGGNVVRLAMGQVQSVSSASDAYETTYTATEDVYVIVGWYWDYYQLELTLTHEVRNTTSKIDELDIISDALDVEVETSTKTTAITLVSHSGSAYANGNVGRGVSMAGYSQYSYSDDFFLKKGDTINISVKNVATSICVLCVKDASPDGTIHRGLALGNGGTQTIEYTAPLDGYYAVSWLTSTGITITKTATSTTGDSERILAIEQATTQIPSLADSVADMVDAVFSDVTDNFTEGIVDGSFVAANGSIGTNSSFFYKEFSLKAGVQISFTASGHTNCAPISKKISSGVYQVLATPASGTNTWTYTTTERCTIALSGYKGSPSATFHTQEINTNSLDIDVLYNKLNLHDKMLKIPDYGLLFDKVAVIGDSLTVGALDAVSGDDAHAAGGSFGCSWLTCLAKRWGSTIRMHYGVGGSTCYSWLGSNQYGLGLMLKDSVIYDAYFIAYGHNDTGQYTIGTTSDTPTPVTVDANNDVTMETAKADTTFLGNYKAIVNYVRTKAPNALIFMLCTDAKDSSSSGSIGYMNQKIKSLAEWYYEQGDHRVFYVDYINSYVRKSGDHTGGHWSTFGYVNIALAINDALNAVIEQYMNTNALKAWGNYLESYRTTQINTTTSGGYLPHL